MCPKANEVDNLGAGVMLKMPDKRAVCSRADCIVFDIIPEKIRRIIDKNVGISEDIRAVVKGMKDETLVITDNGVYIIKKEKCNFFPYEEIMDEKYLYRVYRRGRFEIPLKGKGKVRLPDESTEPDFGPDPAPNVVNFPWSKFEMFEKAEEILSINKELHDNKAALARDSATADKDQERHTAQELMQEIRDLKEQLAMLKKK